MRIAAIISAALATLALYAGLFFYFLTELFACFDYCPPVSSYTDQWYTTVAMWLAPGVGLAVVASALAIIAMRLERRTTALILAVAVPILSVIAVVLLLAFVAGGLTPIANMSAPAADPSEPVVSSAWITGSIFASLPLGIWPLATFLIALIIIKPATKLAPAPVSSQEQPV